MVAGTSGDRVEMNRYIVVASPNNRLQRAGEE
jgi:hypothetical protein